MHEVDSNNIEMGYISTRPNYYIIDIIINSITDHIQNLIYMHDDHNMKLIPTTLKWAINQALQHMINFLGCGHNYHAYVCRLLMKNKMAQLGCLSILMIGFFSGELHDIIINACNYRSTFADNQE